jgi:hypothetical protein
MRLIFSGNLVYFSEKTGTPQVQKGPCQLLAVQQSEDGSPPPNVAKSDGTVPSISFCSSNKRTSQMLFEAKTCIKYPLDIYKKMISI